MRAALALLVLLGCTDGEEAPPDAGTKDASASDDAGSDACATLAQPRMRATATQVANGVLIVGGIRIDNAMIELPRAIELLDPFDLTTQMVAELPAGEERSEHTATLLGDGRVFVAGGQIFANARYTAQRTTFLIDGDTVTPGPRLGEARSGHTAAVLPDGRVILVGGRDPNSGAPLYRSSIEIYDPSTNMITTSSVALSAARAGHTMTAVGDVWIVAGGENESGGVPSLEIIRLNGMSLEAILQIPTLSSPIGHAAAVLDGMLVVSGGSSGGPSNAIQTFSVAADGRSIAEGCSGQLTTARTEHTMSAYANELVVAGGRSTATLDSVEIFTDPCAPPESTQTLCDARSSQTALAVATGVLLIGGLQQMSGQPLGETTPTFELVVP